MRAAANHCWVEFDIANFNVGCRLLRRLNKFLLHIPGVAALKRSTPATVFFVNLIKWLFKGNKKTSGYSTTVSDTFSEAGVPGLVAFDHRIEDGQHLSHAGDNRDLL